MYRAFFKDSEFVLDKGGKVVVSVDAWVILLAVLTLYVLIG